ncbi:hypothetical protein [Nodosilinea nodulosa]|uniref:hypothetical protein n=1 Tax=Nodosilinea nodulosa TaxID=416001 RepID=UPI00031BD004|nr:hypothetical protein [Nodosilinea nodulosa]
MERIELRTSNAAGDEVTRSVVIEKAAAYNPSGNLPGAAGQLPIVSLPLPPSVEGLEPVQTPPQAD